MLVDGTVALLTGADLVCRALPCTRFDLTSHAHHARRQCVCPIASRLLTFAVIGGGLSGLCLANGLLNEKIDVVVYEREQMDARKDGYQIRMGASLSPRGTLTRPATAGYEGLRRAPRTSRSL